MPISKQENPQLAQVQNWRTRFAPSPTGYLHLGHLLSCAIVFGIGRHLKANIDLRLENHDQKRCLPLYSAAILEDLAWCGFHFDKQKRLGGSIPEVYIQSNRQDAYDYYAQALVAAKKIYFCNCSRSQQKQRGCLTVGGHLIYDNFCRHRNLENRQETWRLRFDQSGPQGISDYSWSKAPDHDKILLDRGDFPIRDRDGFWTYQWAVVCDDIDQNINLVIRGLDIWPTTKRYLALWDLLNTEKRQPIFIHHPLILGENGEKISKSDLAKPLRTWRNEGHSPASLLAKAFHAIDCFQDHETIEVSQLANLLQTLIPSGWQA